MIFSGITALLVLYAVSSVSRIVLIEIIAIIVLIILDVISNWWANNLFILLLIIRSISFPVFLLFCSSFAEQKARQNDNRSFK